MACHDTCFYMTLISPDNWQKDCCVTQPVWLSYLVNLILKNESAMRMMWQHVKMWLHKLSHTGLEAMAWNILEVLRWNVHRANHQSQAGWSLWALPFLTALSLAVHNLWRCLAMQRLLISPSSVGPVLCLGTRINSCRMYLQNTCCGPSTGVYNRQRILVNRWKDLKGVFVTPAWADAQLNRLFACRQRLLLWASWIPPERYAYCKLSLLVLANAPSNLHILDKWVVELLCWRTVAMLDQLRRKPFLIPAPCPFQITHWISSFNDFKTLKDAAQSKFW